MNIPIPNEIQQFMSMVEGRFALAIIMMAVIFAGVCYLINLLVVSLKTRRKKMKVELPAIDDSGDVLLSEPQFDINREITTELIHPDNDVTFGPEKVNNEEFAKALTMETKVLISFEDEKNVVVMPEIGNIDYEKIKKEKIQELKKMKEEQENARLSHLKELAIADSNDELSEIMKQ